MSVKYSSIDIRNVLGFFICSASLIGLFYCLYYAEYSPSSTLFTLGCFTFCLLFYVGYLYEKEVVSGLKAAFKGVFLGSMSYLFMIYYFS